MKLLFFNQSQIGEFSDSFKKFFDKLAKLLPPKLDEDGNEIVKEEVPEEEEASLGGDDPNIFSIPEELTSEAGG